MTFDDQRVVLKAVSVVTLLIVGCLLVYANQANKNVSVETSTQIPAARKQKHRNERLLQTVQDLLFPDDICQAQPSAAMANVNGLCSYMNGLNGCCTSTRVPSDIPQIEPSAACSSTCLSMLYSLWCFVPCTDGVESDVNPVDTRRRLCSEPVSMLFENCNNCPAFGSYANLTTYTTQLSTIIPIGDSPCSAFYNADRRLPVETSGPSVAANPSPSTPVALTATSNPQFVTITEDILIEQPATGTVVLPPAFGTFGWRNPAGDLTAQVTKTSFDFTVWSSNVWRTTHSITLGRKALTGEWTLVAVNVNNLNNTIRDQPVRTVQFTSDFTQNAVTAWGPVQLCSGNSNDHTGSSVLRLTDGQTVTALTCCDPQGCSIRCDTTSGANPNSVDSVDATNGGTTDGIPLTIQDCSLISNQGAPTWLLSDSTTLTASPSVVFSGTGKRVQVGRPNGNAAILSSDASAMTFQNAARLDHVGGGSTLALGVSSQFASTSSLNMNGVGQTLSIVNDITVTIQGTLSMILANQMLNIVLGPSGRRNHLLIDGAAGAGNLNGRDNNVLNTVNIRSGRMEVVNGGTVTANVVIQPAMTTRKITTQQVSSDPKDSVGEICCGSTCGRNIIIQDAGVLFIVPAENSQDATCSVAGATQPTAAIITGSLTMNDFSRIVFTGATRDGPVLRIQNADNAPNAFVVGQNVVYEVELSPANASTDTYSIVLAEWPVTSNQCSQFTATVVVVNESPTRPITQSCVLLPNANAPTRQQLVITIPAAQPVRPVATTLPQFRSQSSYIITFNQDLETFPEASLLQTIREVAGVEPERISILSYIEDSNNNIIATFDCLSTQSQQHADSICSNLVADAQNSQNSLNQRLQVLRTSTDGNLDTSDDDSNTALYGLFGLLALCPILCLAVCLFLKNKRRKADNQYVQDTATFSNVAVSPQAINYPMPMNPTQQAIDATPVPVPVLEPVVAVDAPAGYIP